MMEDYILSGHEPSRLPAEKNWQLIWNDEFDGTELDTSKWGFRLNFWGKPFPAFTTEGVVLDGQSHLQLHVVKKGDQYCSPHLQTASLFYDVWEFTHGKIIWRGIESFILFIATYKFSR